MNYRKFGNTGEQISALGFGCMRLPEIEVDGKKVYKVEGYNIVMDIDRYNFIKNNGINC